MKRFLRKILEMVSILIVGYQQFCYADAIVNDPVDDIKPIIFFTLPTPFYLIKLLNLFLIFFFILFVSSSFIIYSFINITSF